MAFLFFSDLFHRRGRELDREKRTAAYHRLSKTAESGSSTLLPSQLIEQSLPKVNARVVSDAIIGLSDGLTVPFALTAGLSTLGETKVVIYGGLAELIAGAISMGLGGYLAAKSEEASYRATMRDTQDLVVADPSSISTSLSAIFAPYDLPSSTLDELTVHLAQSSKLPDFLVRFQHALEQPAETRAVTCACTIALGYFVGGFVPLLPYFLVEGHQVITALCLSALIMIIALFFFGYGKTCFVSGWKGSTNVTKGIVGGIQMIVVGSVAACSAMGIVRVFQQLLSASEASRPP